MLPRLIWNRVKTRPEISEPGVYILIGNADSVENPDDDRPLVYVGQADNVMSRIESHAAGKDFWDRAVVFISTSQPLNRGYITWLEHALIDRAHRFGLCRLDNGAKPQKGTNFVGSRPC